MMRTLGRRYNGPSGSIGYASLVYLSGALIHDTSCLVDSRVGRLSVGVGGVHTHLCGGPDVRSMTQSGPVCAYEFRLRGLVPRLAFVGFVRDRFETDESSVLILVPTKYGNSHPTKEQIVVVGRL